MTINDPRDEAILTLASAIHHINMNSKSRALAERAEGIVRGARMAEDLSAQRDKLTASAEQLERAMEASEMFSNHMPVSVSTFGGSNGVHGWTGTDAAGNRVTWTVETAGATGDAEESSRQLTDEALMLNELRAIRAELKALREHSGARATTITDSERFAHMPPPAGAKRGRWEVVVGSALPVWVESAPMEYDPAMGATSKSVLEDEMKRRGVLRDTPPGTS